MGEAEIDDHKRTITICSHLIIYGNAASDELARSMREEIENMWNEPEGVLYVKGELLRVCFSISAQYKRDIEDIDVYANTDPRNNYFRVEEFAFCNISFVDGTGCNSGYFKFDNLYTGSTTAAHEYGHTLGLNHPYNVDIRGKGIPGIMYPRGTIVDPEFQYDPEKPAGVTGGTMHPKYRKVFLEDIAALKLDKLRFVRQRAIVGNFTNIYHADHT